MKEIKRKKKKEVTISNRGTGEEKTFDSVKEASGFLGCTPNHLSGIISGKRKNGTKYIYSTD